MTSQELTAETVVQSTLHIRSVHQRVEEQTRHAHGTYQLAQAHAAETTHVLSQEEYLSIELTILKTANLLMGACLGSHPQLTPRLHRPVEHECVRVVRQAVTSGKLDVRP